MKILQVHNYYQLAGGEDQVAEAEADLLEAHGHKVIRYRKHNNEVKDVNRFLLAKRTVWNGQVLKELRQILQDERPAVIHCHNTFPLVSPSVYYAAGAEGIPVVQTLHNYRLVCPNALLFREGHVCEDCLGKVPWPGVRHACYRNGRLATGTVAGMLVVHRLLDTWSEKVTRYLALTEFSRDVFIRAGLPSERIQVKPNFLLSSPGIGDRKGGYVLFLGRLSAEKGVGTLLRAWTRLRDIPLKIAGDGPMSPEVQRAAAQSGGIDWVGWQSQAEMLALLKDARLLVFPSECYETFGMTIIEAFSVGLPVICSNIGSGASLVDHRRVGLHFRAGDAEDLANTISWAFAHPAALDSMAKEARQEFEEYYTAERNLQMLEDIYASIVSSRG